MRKSAYNHLLASKYNACSLTMVEEACKKEGGLEYSVPNLNVFICINNIHSLGLGPWQRGVTGGRRKERCKLKSTASDHAVGSTYIRDTGVVVAEQQQLVQNTVQADDIHVDAYSKCVVLDNQSSQCDSTTQGTVNLQVEDCSHVDFELRDNTSGVRYAVNGGIEPAWTPAVRRKSCRKRSYDKAAIFAQQMSLVVKSSTP